MGEVRKFISKHPEIKSKKGIARELVSLGLYTDIEDARRDVRTATGANGEADRRKTKDPEKQKFWFNGFERWADENLNNELQPWAEPFQIPKFKQLNVIADLHSVHLDRGAFKSFIKQTKDKEAVLLNGDLLDSESLSRHLKTHNVIAYEKELSICHEILKGLKQEFTHVYFKEGNHDWWLERYLLSNAREVFRALGVSLPLLLKLPELGIHHIHNLKYWTYGDLDGVHGHEFPGFGLGKFPATGLLDKWQTFKGRYDVKILGSHAHRADQAMSKKSKDGKFGLGWITPAMCKKGAHYAPYAGWDCGWTKLNIVDGETKVQNVIFD